MSIKSLPKTCLFGLRIRTFSLEGEKGIKIIGGGIRSFITNIPYRSLWFQQFTIDFPRCTYQPVHTTTVYKSLNFKLEPTLNFVLIPEPQQAHYLYLELAKCCNGTFIDQVLFAFFIMTRDTIKHARHGRMLFSDKIAKLQSRVRSFTNFYCASFLFITL